MKSWRINGLSMKKNLEIFLANILESIDEIESYTQDATEKDFLQSHIMQDAVMRRLEIIGEAVRNIPMSFRNQHENIPWKKIAGIRDILIHEYFSVDIGLVWEIVQKDIPKLKSDIVALLNDL